MFINSVSLSVRDRGLHRPGPARQMRHDFFNEPGRQRKGDFSNGPGRVGKREMSFSIGGPGYKKIPRIILHVRTGSQNKDEVFKQADKRLIMNLT